MLSAFNSFSWTTSQEDTTVPERLPPRSPPLAPSTGARADEAATLVSHWVEDAPVAHPDVVALDDEEYDLRDRQGVMDWLDAQGLGERQLLPDGTYETNEQANERFLGAVEAVAGTFSWETGRYEGGAADGERLGMAQVMLAEHQAQFAPEPDRAQGTDGVLYLGLNPRSSALEGSLVERDAGRAGLAATVITRGEDEHVLTVDDEEFDLANREELLGWLAASGVDEPVIMPNGELEPDSVADERLLGLVDALDGRFSLESGLYEGGVPLEMRGAVARYAVALHQAKRGKQDISVILSGMSDGADLHGELDDGGVLANLRQIHDAYPDVVANVMLSASHGEALAGQLGGDPSRVLAYDGSCPTAEQGSLAHLARFVAALADGGGDRLEEAAATMRNATVITPSKDR